MICIWGHHDSEGWRKKKRHPSARDRVIRYYIHAYAL